MGASINTNSNNKRDLTPSPKTTKPISQNYFAKLKEQHKNTIPEEKTEQILDDFNNYTQSEKDLIIRNLKDGTFGSPLSTNLLEILNQIKSQEENSAFKPVLEQVINESEKKSNSKVVELIKFKQNFGNNILSDTESISTESTDNSVTDKNKTEIELQIDEKLDTLETKINECKTLKEELKIISKKLESDSQAVTENKDENLDNLEDINDTIALLDEEIINSQLNLNSIEHSERIVELKEAVIATLSLNLAENQEALNNLDIKLKNTAPTFKISDEFNTVQKTIIEYINLAKNPESSKNKEFQHLAETIIKDLNNFETDLNTYAQSKLNQIENASEEDENVITKSYEVVNLELETVLIYTQEIIDQAGTLIKKHENN
jgi:hypothetical protein